jgi:hypothetical protein
MKKIAFCAIVTAIVVLTSVSAPAQENNMAVGAGFDIMLPMGTFGDQWSTGFGGTAQFDYAVSTHTTVTGKIGYLTWSGKQAYYTSSSSVTNFSASYSGVPVLVGVKYYPHLFVTQSQTPVRVYGHLELGLMFGSSSVSGSYRGFLATYSLSTSASKTDFTIVPSIGAEIPVVPKGAIDVSVRYFDIASHGNFGFRVGYKMTLG